MLIHAYSRKEPITVELFDELYKFEQHPENKKAFVAEVTDQAAIDRLLEITEGYVEYGTKPVKQKVKSTPTASADDGLTDAERELGFRLNPTTDPEGRTPEAIAFEESERQRVADEEREEREAQEERDRALAEAAEKEKKEAAERAARAAAFTVKSDDGKTVDLTTMDDAALRTWAKDNGITGINGRAKGDTIRTAIVEAIKAAG